MSVSLVRSWLKDNGIFDKDLEIILEEQGINDPQKDFKNLTQNQWDEIVRQATVARSSDIKDNKSRMRMEEKLTKIEAFWREESGIVKTNLTKAQKIAIKKDDDEKDNLQELELKKWMQKEEIWEKDLFGVLIQRQITCEADIESINTQAAFDEIIREVTVLRRDETKDKDAKMRLEKLLAKFEKIWRSKTGIQKTNIQQTPSSKTKQPPPKDEENEQMATTGKALKTWMQNNEIWEKALYDELISSGIKTESDLSSMTESEFDEIVRKVRVDRFSNMKDQATRQRLDKLLTNFEKQWRQKSGIQKTNIN